MSTTQNPHLNIPTFDQTPATTRRTSVPEFREGLQWARSVLDDPLRASVEASGMSTADLEAIERAAAGSA